MTDNTVKLPELPGPDMTIAGDDPDRGYWYSADKMRAYATAAVMDARSSCDRCERAERWRPIETAPRDGTWILGWRKGWDAPHTMRHAIPGWRSEGCHVSPGPTHFQPIQPPAERSSNSLSREDGDVHEQD